MSIARIAVGALAVVVLSSGVAIATHSAGEGAGQDFVYGTGHVSQAAGFFAFDIHVDARSGPLGEEAEGHWSFMRPEQTWFGFPLAELGMSGSVACLSVAGNRARVRGLVERATNPTAEGQGFEMTFSDGGEPGAGVDGVLTVAFVPADAVNTCPLPAPGALLIESGNFVVHDAP